MSEDSTCGLSGMYTKFVFMGSPVPLLVRDVHLPREHTSRHETAAVPLRDELAFPMVTAVQLVSQGQQVLHAGVATPQRVPLLRFLTARLSFLDRTVQDTQGVQGEPGKLTSPYE